MNVRLVRLFRFHLCNLTVARRMPAFSVSIFYHQFMICEDDFFISVWILKEVGDAYLVVVSLSLLSCFKRKYLGFLLPSLKMCEMSTSPMETSKATIIGNARFKCTNRLELFHFYFAPSKDLFSFSIHIHAYSSLTGQMLD